MIIIKHLLREVIKERERNRERKIKKENEFIYIYKYSKLNIYKMGFFFLTLRHRMQRIKNKSLHKKIVLFNYNC